MEKAITYFGIESIEYVFAKHEVLQALLETYKIKHSSNIEFRLYEPFDDEPAFAKLTIRYTKVKDET